jgi:hypothetical protein
MRQHYNLDRLAEYGVEPLPDITRVINAPWRAFDCQIRSQNALLSHKRARFAETGAAPNAFIQAAGRCLTRRQLRLVAIEARTGFAALVFWTQCKSIKSISTELCLKIILHLVLCFYSKVNMRMFLRYGSAAKLLHVRGAVNHGWLSNCSLTVNLPSILSELRREF